MPGSSIIDSEFKGLLGCWSLISSQGDSHLWPFSRQQAHCPSILEQPDTGFSTHFTASEHSLLIYWSMSACGGSSEQILCALTTSCMDFFSPPFFSPFYQGVLAVWGAAGIRACRSPIYQSWMCLAPVGQSSLPFFSFLFPVFFICPKLSEIPIPHILLLCLWVLPFPYLLFEIVLKSNTEKAKRRGLGELIYFFPVVCLLPHPITSTLLPKTKEFLLTRGFE